MAVAVNTSRFEGVAMKLNLLSEAFKADTNDMKLNLGVGAYRTEELQPYVLNVVKKYLPIEGLDAFNKVTAELLFGVDNVVIQQGGVEKVKQDIKNKDGQIKKMEETIYSLDVKNKGKDLINKNLQEKVKELESQLLIERKLARQHVDAKIAEKQKEK